MMDSTAKKTKLTIAPCTYQLAKAFVRDHHRHSLPPIGCKFCVAVVDDDVLHGVAICGRPISRHLDDGFTLEIVRVCTDGTPNACSMLYGACIRIAREMGYRDVYTYTLQSENGASVKASNFECEGEAGGLHWTGKRDRGQALPKEMKTRWHMRITRKKR